MKKILFALAALVLVAGIVCSVMLGMKNQNTAKDSVIRLYGEDDYAYVVSDGLKVGTFGYSGTAVAIGYDKEGNLYFATNRHCVEVSEEELISTLPYKSSELLGFSTEINGAGTLADRVVLVPTNANDMVSVTVVAASDRTDLAIVRATMPIPSIKPISIRAFDKLDSETVYALGFPGVADNIDKSGVSLASGKSHISVTSGTVSRVVENDESREGQLVQINAEIYHGNSGGALVDAHGKLLGINASGYESYDVNFAVSANEVVRLCRQENIPITLTRSFTEELLIVLGIAFALAAVLCVAAVLCGKKKTQSKNVPKTTIGKTQAAAAWQLQGTKGVFAGKQVTISGQLSIGRAVSNDLSYPETTNGVSTHHCVLTVRADGIAVQDMSTYGTYVNGVKVPKGETMVMRAGDRISLGSEKEVFVLRQTGAGVTRPA